MSEVAKFRREQAALEAAAKNALSGLAAVARHSYITKRMEQLSPQFKSLAQQGKAEEAFQLLEDLCKEIAGLEQEGKAVSNPSQREENILVC